MNGSFLNYLSHSLIGLTAAVIFFFLGAGVWCILPGIFYFYGKEVGEKAKERGVRPGPEQPSKTSDLNPFDKRWTKDDRLDLLSGMLGSLGGLVLVL